MGEPAKVSGWKAKTGAEGGLAPGAGMLGACAVKRLSGVDGRRRHARSGSGIGNATVERRYDRHGAAERARQRREVGFGDKGGLRTSNREVADASDRDRRRRHIRAGGSLLATWRNGLCRCRLTLRRQRLIRVQRRRRPCGARPRHAACPWRRRGDRGRGAALRGAWNLRRQRIHGEHGRARAWPRNRLARQTAEQRVRDRGNPGGVGRLALPRRYPLKFAAEGDSRRTLQGRPSLPAIREAQAS